MIKDHTSIHASKSRLELENSISQSTTQILVATHHATLKNCIELEKRNSANPDKAKLFVPRHLFYLLRGACNVQFTSLPIAA